MYEEEQERVRYVAPAVTALCTDGFAETAASYRHVDGVEWSRFVESEGSTTAPITRGNLCSVPVVMTKHQ